MLAPRQENANIRCTLVFNLYEPVIFATIPYYYNVKTGSGAHPVLYAMSKRKGIPVTGRGGP
jgi:hypothetical protein